MATLNEVIRERRLVLANLKRALKRVDSSLEVAERYLSNALRRKRKVPETEDLKRLDKMAIDIAVAMEEFAKLVDKGWVI